MKATRRASMQHKHILGNTQWVCSGSLLLHTDTEYFWAKNMGAPAKQPHSLQCSTHGKKAELHSNSDTWTLSSTINDSLNLSYKGKFKNREEIIQFHVILGQVFSTTGWTWLSSRSQFKVWIIPRKKYGLGKYGVFQKVSDWPKNTQGGTLCNTWPSSLYFLSWIGHFLAQPALLISIL